MIMDGRHILRNIRDDLRDINDEITSHRLLQDAESGKLPRRAFGIFIEQQKYIIPHDAKSLALMATRSREHDEASYFLRLSEGDLESLRLLGRFEESLGSSGTGAIIPHAVSYTHYLAWLALYGSPGLQTLALVVNLPIWSSNCARLSWALKEVYDVRETGFLDYFSEIPGWVEEEACRIMERYEDDVEEHGLEVARLIQAYELSFWDGIMEATGRTES